MVVSPSHSVTDPPASLRVVLERGNIGSGSIAPISARRQEDRSTSTSGPKEDIPSLQFRATCGHGLHKVRLQSRKIRPLGLRPDAEAAR